jgi:cation diffusion facilitator family transporter
MTRAPMSSHAHDLSRFRHRHDFGDAGAARREAALRVVVVLTFVTMVVELVVGAWSGSLALTADGWHMGTHAVALGGAVLAYRLSARAVRRGGYAFGGWKIEVLAGYTSALLLLAVALWLLFEGVQALRQPRAVNYLEAMAVAAIGLVVNLVSAWLLARGAAVHEGGHAPGHAHGHARGHSHGHAHHHGDHNFSAAYLHVLADAFTSVLAIVALAGGAWWGMAWLDPAAALLGAAVIAHWSIGILRSSASALVDASSDTQLAERVRSHIEADGDAKLSDLHVWQIGPQAWCAVVAVVADTPLSPLAYRERLRDISHLRHVTIEVHRCEAAHASPA